MSSPTWRDLLTDGFRYDDYANRAWLPVIVENGTDSETALFQHLLSASEIWLRRVEGTAVTERPVVALTSATLDDLLARWLTAVSSFDFEQAIEFTTLRATCSRGHSATSSGTSNSMARITEGRSESWLAHAAWSFRIQTTFSIRTHAKTLRNLDGKQP